MRRSNAYCKRPCPGQAPVPGRHVPQPRQRHAAWRGDGSGRRRRWMGGKREGGHEVLCTGSAVQAPTTMKAAAGCRGVEPASTSSPSGGVLCCPTHQPTARACTRPQSALHSVHRPHQHALLQPPHRHQQQRGSRRLPCSHRPEGRPQPGRSRARAPVSPRANPCMRVCTAVCGQQRVLLRWRAAGWRRLQSMPGPHRTPAGGIEPARPCWRPAG